MPVAGERTQVWRNVRIDEAFGGSLRANHSVQIVLLMWLKLRNEEEKWLFVLLPKKALRAICDEVDAILVTICDLPAVAIVDRSFVWVSGVFERIRSLP